MADESRTEIKKSYILSVSTLLTRREEFVSYTVCGLLFLASDFSVTGSESTREMLCRASACCEAARSGRSEHQTWLIRIVYDGLLKLTENY